MTADEDSSDLSSLSSLSPVPSDVELDDASDDGGSEPRSGILKFFPKLSNMPAKEPSPPPRKRSPSPPHEYVLADNPDIAFIVMFRSRFSDAFPKSLAHFGPQELERDVVEPVPGDRVEHFLCALLGLLLNRKQDVKLGHYGRALEDAIASHKGQWPPSWEEKNPLSGSATFNSMTPTERLTLLRTLILWSMASSDSVKGLINNAYKQNRHEDDLNQPRAVQPWGSDGDKRRYFLVEGQDDTNFRIYRESNPAGTNRTWWSVAGTIDELRALVDKLDTKDGGPKAKKLGQKMLQVIPRFEAGEEKRRRREYRQLQKERFKRPEPGFSVYEGRTRGKRIKYTYSDDEDIFFSDSTGQRRSTRNTGANTPAETGPLTTSSGRQIRAPPRLNMVGDDGTAASAHEDHSEADLEGTVGPTGRPRRSAAVNHGTNGWSSRQSRNGLNSDGDSEAEFGDDEDDVDVHLADESEEEDEFDEADAASEEELHDGQPQSLVVKLSLTPPKLRTALSPVESAANTLPTPDTQDFKMEVTPVPQESTETGPPPPPSSNTTAARGTSAMAQTEVRAQTPTEMPTGVFGASKPTPTAASNVAVSVTPKATAVSDVPGPAASISAAHEQGYMSVAKEEPIIQAEAPLTSAVPPKTEDTALQASPPTLLAFRGSPEKPSHSQLVQSPPVNTGNTN